MTTDTITDPVTTLKQMVAQAFKVALRDLDAPTRREAPIATARQSAMYLANVALGMPFAHVARAFGRDRTTASHAARVTEDRRDDPAFDAILSRLESELDALTPTLITARDAHHAQA